MEKIDYKKIIKKHPWIIKKNQKAILSPDSDGFLCGLLMSYYLDWKIVGFYDGKILQIDKDTSAKDCIFLDMEVLRKDTRSLGHHINLHNTNAPPENYHNLMKNCINPNHIRKFDRAHNFPQKYPLGSIHLLLFILDTAYPNVAQINKEGLGAIFFADGVWKILFKYTENFLDWFEFLDSDGQSRWWKELQELTVIKLIKEINALIHKLQKIHPQGKKWYGHIDIDNLEDNKKMLSDFLNLIGTLTGWHYDSRKWAVDNLQKYNFTKKIYEGSTSNEEFLKIWQKNPLSLAMTGGSTIQYTLEKPDVLSK